MPKAISLILPDQSAKKIAWKHQYGCLDRLKEQISSIIDVPAGEIHLLGKTPTSFLLLSNQNSFNDWLSENYSQFSITLQIANLGGHAPKPMLEEGSKIESGESEKLPSSSTQTTQVVAKDKPRSEFKFRKMRFADRKADHAAYRRLKISNFIDFSDSNYSSYHVIFKTEGYLIASGFERLDERVAWTVKPGGKYYIKRGFYSSIIAFIVPTTFDPTKAYFKLLGTHADSPCLRLSPKSKIDGDGFLQLDVETYGGALFKTWFDRELALGGRVTLRDPEDDSKLTVKIYTSTNALAVIPSLPPHLQKVIDETPLNPEQHLRPIIGANMESEGTDLGLPGRGKRAVKSSLQDDHYKFILEDISNQFQVPVESIVDIDLSLADWAGAHAFGPAEDFVAASKMDNTVSVWAALESITTIADDPTVLKDNGIPLIIAFDHEEVGSASFTGADSDFVETTLLRVVTSLNADKECPIELFKSALANSLLVSADMGHSYNPNYPEYFKQNFKPTLNKGILIKTNDSQRYTTSSISRPILKNLADKHQIPVQDFVVRNDKPCGSTIGPIMAKKLGVVAIDVGAPLLAMHSIREIMGSEDMVAYSDLFLAYLSSNLPTVSDIFG